MSDGIDIHEHDIMDKVKEIYLDPDIIVKKELFMDYEDEETDFHHTLPPYPLHTVGKALVEINNADSTTDMLTDMSADHPAPSPQTVTSTNEHAAPPFERNVIILGFKKTKTPKSNVYVNATMKVEARCFDTQLLLNDCGEFLSSCNRFCEDCCTLYPNKNLYECHRMTHHSHLIALPTPDVVRSDTMIEPRRSPITEPGHFQCKLCRVIFTRRQYLLRHYRSVHKKSYLEVDEQLKRMEVCFVCNKTLPTKDDLINHLYAHHHSAKTYNCSICLKVFKEKKTLEEHLFDHAKDKVKQQSLGRPDGPQPASVKRPSAKKSTSIPNKQTITDADHSVFPCEFCDRIFYGKYSLRSHKSFAHKRANRNPPQSLPHKNVSNPIERSKTTVRSSKAPSVIVERKVLRRKPYMVLRTYKCKICSANYVLSKSCYSHIVNKHGCAQPRNFIETVIKTSTKGQPQNFSGKYVYECQKCSLRLPTYKTCYRHYRGRHREKSGANMIKRVPVNAPKKPPSVKTSQANCSIKPVEGPANNIKVAPRGVIFKCRICSICFLSYHIAINHLCHGNIVSTKCAVCDLDFSKDDIAAHYKQHSYKSAFKVILTERKLMQRLLSLCPLCNVHYPESKLLLHLNQCRRVVIGSFVCHICRFPIDSKFQASHRESHKEFKRASDFIVIKYDIIKEKSNFDRDAHSTSVPVARRNGYSFDAEEESNQSALLKRYNSMTTIWNFLYLCNTCDIAIDNYTQLVDHCHDHYCAKKGVLKVASTKCNICNLSFDEKCYDRHYQLHIDNNMITKKSFNILQFHYTKLLKPTWMEELFSSLSVENIDQLTGNSVYKNIRNTKLEVARKGQTEFTVYICYRCKVVIQEDYVLVHLAKNRDGRCVKNARVRAKKCLACNLSFGGNRSWRQHEDLHRTSKISADSFRVIAFNRPQDLKINNILRSATKFSWGKGEKYNLYKCRKCGAAMSAAVAKSHMALPYDCASLKSEYVTCSHCGHSFQRNGFYMHLARHKDVGYNKDNINVILFGNMGENNPAVKSETKYHIYRCKKCMLCVHNKTGINRHLCHKVKYSKTCGGCSLTFSCQIYSDHMKKHNSLENFNLDNIYLIDFDPMVSNNDTEVAKKTTPNYVLYQCEHCRRNVLTAASAIRHQKLSGTCEVSTNVTCKICKLMFWTAKTNLHRQMHKQRPGFQRKNFKIVRFDSKTVLTDLLPHNKERFDPSVDYLHFECQKCMTLLSSKYGAKQHISSCKINAVTIKCTKCHYYISHDSLSKHMKKHKKHPQMSRGNMKIVKFSSHIPDYGAMENDDLTEDDQSNTETEIDESAMKKIWSMTSREKVKGRKKYKLYQCSKCKECFHRFTFLVKHVERNCKSHKVITCKICGYLFKKKNLNIKRLHMMNHTRPDFTKNNVKVITYNPSEIAAHSESQVNRSKGKHNDCELDDTPVSSDNESVVNRSKENHDYCELDDIAKTATDSESDGNRLKGKDNYCELDDTPKTASHSVSKVNRLKRKHNYCELDDEDTQCMEGKRSKNIVKDVKLYKCEFCAIHLSFHSFKIHSKAHTWDKTPGIECNMCGLNIMRRSLKRHIDLQHNKYNLKLEDFEITTFKPNMIDSPVTPIASQTSSRNHNKPIHRKDKRKDTASVYAFDTGNYSNKLYKCRVCELHFITKNSYVTHHKTPHTENITRDKTQCRVCRLSFTPLSCKRHILIHHNNYNLKLKDFEIVSDINNVVQVGAEVETNRRNSKSKTEASFHSGSDSNKVYKCEICDIYFVTMSSLKRHCDIPHTHCTMVTLIRCEICNLRMSKLSLKRHTEMHHTELNLQLDDIDVVTYDTHTKEVKVNGIVHTYTETNGFGGPLRPPIDVNEDNNSIKEESNNLDVEGSSSNSDEGDIEQSNDTDNVKSQVVDENIVNNDKNVIDKTETDYSVDIDSANADINQNPTSDEDCDKDEVENVNLTANFKCEICNEEFTMTKALEIHMKLDHLDKEIECPMCKGSFNTSILHKIHLRELYSVLKCCICKERFSKEELLSHAGKHR